MTKQAVSIYRNLLNRHESVFVFALIVSVVALSGAYLSQYLGYKPCILCIYQRIPYFLIIFFSLIALLISKTRNIVLYIICLLMVGEICIAVYHVGIEHHIIDETSACVTHNQISDNIEEALKQLENTNVTSCANPSLFILGFSVAEWNVVYALGCLLLIIFYRQQNVTRR